MSPPYAPLVEARELAAPSAYRQLTRRAKDHEFRRRLDRVISRVCEGDDRLRNTFTHMINDLGAEGALTFAGLLNAPQFDRARAAYDSAMSLGGSRGSLHSYLNVWDCNSLISERAFRSMFAPPLLVTLVAHRLGAPARIVDLRAKDTQPVDVVARDNTLHIDNSPFIDELKVIVTWTMGTSQGPSGQGLAYLPRTNRLFRQCIVGPDGEVRSDEDSCIFPTRARVDEALAAQSRFYDSEARVVHLEEIAAPCHTVFAASRVVHHRYRRSAGAPRSAVIASFHRFDEGTGHLPVRNVSGSTLEGIAFGTMEPDDFFDAVEAEAHQIREMLARVAEDPRLIVDADAHVLRGEHLSAWLGRQRAGVSLQNLRSLAIGEASDDGVPVEDLIRLRIRYDLQGPLNLPLYPDLGEEIRKRARIVIREMRSDDILAAISPYIEDLACLTSRTDEVIFPADVDDIKQCLEALQQLIVCAPRMRQVNKIWGQMDADSVCRSLTRFIGDLCVAVQGVEEAESYSAAAVFSALGAVLTCGAFEVGEAGAALARRLVIAYFRAVLPSLKDNIGAA